MSNKTYDVLAYIQRIILPAFATLLATLGQIWNWQWPVEQVVLTITAIDTFMGIVLRISSNQYYELQNIDVPDEMVEDEEEGQG